MEWANRDKLSDFLRRMIEFHSSPTTFLSRFEVIRRLFPKRALAIVALVATAQNGSCPLQRECCCCYLSRG